MRPGPPLLRPATALLLVAAMVLAQLVPVEQPRGRAAWLLGPLAQLAADVQWSRFQRARVAGRDELAVARAEDALALAPEDPRGWELLASYLALTLASSEREPDPGRRLAWLRAGLDVARRGEERASDPGALALSAGAILWTHAELDPDTSWPGGTSALREEAASAFERAARHGASGAAELAARARASVLSVDGE